MLIPEKTTAVPNAVFDYWMQRLKPSALCILLLIIRQTLGRSGNETNKKERREVDWISSCQLQEKSNYSRRAITSATEILMKKKLIEVFDERGNLLLSPNERKGKQRLYYGLTKQLLFSSYPVDRGWKKEEDRYNPREKFAEELRKNVTALAQEMRIT